MASFQDWYENKNKKDDEKEGGLSFQEWVTKRGGIQTSTNTAPQPSKDRTTPAQTGRLRPGWSVEDVERAAEKTSYQKAVESEDNTSHTHLSGRFGETKTSEDKTPSTHLSGRVGETKTSITKEDVIEASNNYDKAKANSFNASMALGAALTVRGQNPFSDNMPEVQATANSAIARAQAAKAEEQNALAQFNSIAAQYQEQERERKYDALRKNPEFAAKSKGDEETAREAARKMGTSGIMAAYYQIYHRNDPVKTTEDMMTGLGASLLARELNRAQQPNYTAGNDLSFIRDDEADTFFYLWNTQGPKAASTYLDSIRSDLNARRNTEQEKLTIQYAQEHPVKASAESVLQNQFSIAGMVDLTVQNLRRQFGDKTKPIDYNTPAQDFGKTTQRIRDTVSKSLEEKYPDATVLGITNLASFVYQTGMSMADSGVQLVMNRLGVPEPITLSLMSGGAAQQAVYDAKRRGASDGQALLFGYASGIAEYAFEKMSLDSLVGSIESKAGETIGEQLTRNWATNSKFQRFVKNLASGIINVGKQGGTEASEELFTSLANTVSDIMINQDKAELFADIQHYIDNGVDPQVASKMAIKDWVNGLITDTLGGLVSGVGMGGTGTGLRAAVNYGSNVGQAVGDYVSGVREDIASARQMTNTVYDTPLAQQAVDAPEQAEAPAETRSPLQAAVDKLNAGEQLSEKDAKAIMNDPQAIQTLRDAGLPETLRPGAEGRTQVRQAVEQYAQQMQAEGPTVSQESAPATQEVQTQAEQQNAPQATQDSTQGIQLKTAEETLTPAPKPANLLAQNRTEVNNNGQQAQAPTPAQTEQRTGTETRAVGQQSVGGDQRRAPDLGTRGGRFIQNFQEARAQRQQRNRAASIRYNVAAAGEQALSTKDVGFANGTDAKTFAMLPERLVTRDMRKARDVLTKEGVNVHYIQGFLQLQNAAGGIDTARGIISPDGKDIWVRADNTILSWQQLLDHELMHRKFQQDPGLRDRILNQLRADPEVAPYFEEVVRQYVQWYNEYNVTDEDEILTELLCDYAGGFNDVQATDTAQRGTKYDVSGIKQVQKVIQTEAHTKSIAAALDSGNYEASIQHSYESVANAAGFQAVEKDGERYYVRNGERVTRVTEDDIRSSPIGALISFAADEGYLGNTPEENKAAADAQVKFFSDLCTLATSNNDFGMSMNMAGAVAFTAIKSNADHQYGTTVDFKSICVKTQAIIDAMSAAMVEKQGALTKPEILAIYRRTALNGLPVPCPECYVFSRWIGIGGLLDNIWKYQNHYAGMTERQVSEARENIVRTINDKMAELNANLPADKQLTFGKARGKLKDSVAKQYNKLREKIDLADNTGAAVSATDREKLAGLESMMTDVKALSWIDDVYFGGNPAAGKKNPRFEVPADILFDLNKGGEFATQYPEAWGFRTTQGAGYGKAITPYADARIGEAILGAANITSTTKGRLQGNLNNPFSNLQGAVDDDAKKKLRQAVAKQKAQLFRGGQRFSSTSDVSNDIASDLLIAMLDMQSMHAGVQMYTKVDGAVGGLSGMGAFVNQSLMPLGSGIKNGELSDTAVGGMDPKVAFSNRNRYETAGTITIGVNDRHIRMLFNAINRDFVIPYHASGGDQNLVGEMRSINDPDEGKVAKVRSSDYTKTQNDKVMSDLLLRELGKTDEEIETIHRNRAARLAILTNTKAEPDMSVVRANPILSELYDRFNGGIWDGVKLTKDDVESFIYPNEFWDDTVDYDNSSRNTQLYLDYCDALGFLHRFSGVTPQSVRLPGGGTTTRLQPVKGYDENGNQVMLTDLAYIYDEDGNKTDEIEPFFWKSLVDRRMYDNDGKYLPPRTIRLTGLTTEDITEFAKHNVGRQYSPAASADLANQVRDIVNQNKGNTEAMVSALREVLDKQSTDGGSNSEESRGDRAPINRTGGSLSRESDTAYLAAVEAGDMETAQRMVDEAAKRAGYDLKVYHGTANGGHFTLFDPSKLSNTTLSSQIGQGFYFTNNKKAAKDYTRNTNIYGKTTKGSDPHLFSGYLKLSNPLEISMSSHNLSEDTIRSIVTDGGYAWFLESGIPHHLQNKEIDGKTYAKNELAAMSEAERIDLYAKYLAKQGDKYALQQMVLAYPSKEQDRLLESMKKHLGRDGIVWRMNDESVQYVAFDSSQFKESDPVTYDDNGNVIPLSERFNPYDADIRFSREFMPENLVPYTGGPRGRGRSTNPRKKVSRVRTHAFELGGLYNEVEAQMAETQPGEFTYDPISEQRSMNEALGRLKKDFAGEAEKLASSDQWGGSDLDTAMGILYQYRQIGRETGDYSLFNDWSHVIQQKGTKGGQFVQAFAKYSRTATGVAQKAAENLRDQHALTPAQQKRVERHVNELLGAMDDFAEEAARGAVENARGGKEGLKLPSADTAAAKQIERLKNRVQQLRDEKSALQKELNTAQQKNGRLDSANQFLKDKLAEKNRQLKEAEKELDKARKQVDRLGRRLGDLADKYEREQTRRKDAESIIRQIHQIWAKQNSRDHGAPVEEWTKLTGDQLASRIASRFNSGNKQRTTMQTILDDLLTYASEHALPKREGKTPRTATERITDYLNNREAYGEAWSEAKQVLREMYANDQEKLDALEAFLNSTISYNGEDLDQTMFRAILESADALGLTKDDILKLTAAGVNEGTIDRITEEFLQRIGSDDTNLRDTVARHITNLAMADNQEGRLGRMENEAAKELDLKLQNLLRESKQTKSSAANAIAQYLINDLGISGTDAAIAADHIASHYMERIEQKAAQTLEKMFAEKGERVKPQQRDKLMDLIHLGGLTNANVEDAVVDALGLNKVTREQQRQIMDAMAQFADTLDAIENDDLEGLRNLIRLQAAARGTKLSSLTEEILSGETDAEYLRNFATTQLGLIAADYDARSAGEKISTLQVISHLLNARTAMRNVTSNQVFDIVDSTANNVGLLPDLIMSKITGQRTVGLEKSWFSQAKRQGATKGMGRNILEVALDVDPEGRNRSKYGTGGRRTFSMASSGTVGKILSKAEEIMGYELNTTDEFHKGSVYAETLESLGRFVDAGYMTEEEAAEFAAQEALYRSFQDDTKMGAFLSGLKDVLNVIAGTGKTNGKTIHGLPVHDFGLGDLVVKYTQVPGALIHRAIEFSPVGYIKAIYNIAQLGNAKSRGESTIKQQRNAALALGRATTGSGLIMLFTLLAKLGLLRRGDDEKNKDAATLKNSQGLSGTQINLTAIDRLLSGGSAEPQQGDVLHDIGFLEPLDSLMTIAALINNDPEIKNLNLYEMFRSAETAKELVGKSLQGIWLALEDTSAMQTLSNIYSTIRYHDEENDRPLYMQIPMEIASSSISGFIPAPIRQIAQATDTTYRDQYRSQDLLKQTGARVANAIPGLRKQLAPKLTPLGEDKTYQEPWLNALNALVNPGNISVYQTDKARDELLRVYEETGEGSMLPARNAPYSINIGGESYTLTPDERTEYLRIRGQEETKFVESLLTANWYRNADADTKAAFLNSAKNIANDVAKSQWAAERGITYHDTTYRKYLKMLADGTRYADVIKANNEDLVDTVEAGIPRQVWDATKAAFNDIANSDISSYEKGVQQRALISDLEDLDDQQKLLVYGDLANAESREEQFRTVMDTGLSFNETAKIFDQYSAYKSEDETRASQDAKDFALWVDQRKDLTSEQKKVVKEQFKYWQMIPAEAERYEKYTGMGFAPEVASRIDSALSELKPLPGHDGVTDMQRTKAAIGALGKNASQSDQMKIVESFYGGSTTTKSGELSQWGKIKKVTGSGVTVDKTLKLIDDGSLDEYVNWMDWSKEVTPERKVDSNVYIKFQKTYNSTSSTYDEATGKAIKGQEKKDKVMAYIDGLNLTIDQKDGLYLTRYKESGLKDTPWHKGGSSGKGKTYAASSLRLPTPERRAPITNGLKLPAAPTANPRTGGLKLR